MPIETILQAKRLIERRRVDNPATAGNLEYHISNEDACQLASDIYKISRSMQGAEGGWKDFSQFGRIIWQRILKREAEGPEFEKFNKGLIGQFLRVDYKDIVYPGTSANISGFIKNNRNRVRHLAIWTMGDVSYTGYQMSKAESTGLLPDIYQQLSTIGEKERSEFFDKKTIIMVDDDKFARLESLLAKLLQEKNQDGAPRPVKLVIVEDTRENFKKAELARDRVCEKCGVNQHAIEVVPVWAAYSRKAKKEEEKAKSAGAGETEKFSRLKRELNSIESLSELSGEKFNGVMEGATVLLDMDGVLLDERKTREAIGKIMFNAAVSELVSSKNMGAADAEEELKNLVKNIINGIKEK